MELRLESLVALERGRLAQRLLSDNVEHMLENDDDGERRQGSDDDKPEWLLAELELKLVVQRLAQLVCDKTEQRAEEADILDNLHCMKSLKHRLVLNDSVEMLALVLAMLVLEQQELVLAMPVLQQQELALAMLARE